MVIKCKIPGCNDIAHKNNLCVRHLLIERWCDNSNIDDLGVIRFFQYICPKAFKNFRYGIPRIHKEILYEVCLDRPSWKVFDRQLVIAAPRGIAKTTLISKGFALYCALNGLKKYIVLASKTARTAQKALRWIKTMLSNSKVISIYGDLRPDVTSHKLEYDSEIGKYTSETIILRNGCTIEALGMGQQIRSAAEGEESNRIDLFIADDCETNENTATASSRQSNEEWLFETVFPSLDIDNGTLVYINTLTHSESILAKLLKSDGWRKKFYQITYTDEDGVERSIWPEKFSMEVIDGIKNWYKSNGQESAFYKEYYNTVLSSVAIDSRWFKKFNGRVFIENGYKWLEADGAVKPAVVSLGIDSSFSFSESADWTVLLPLVRTPDNHRYVFPISRGRFSVYDSDSRKGIINEAIRLHKMYHFDVITVDIAGQQSSILELLHIAFNEEFGPGVVSIYGYNATKERKPKLDRLYNYLRPKYEAGVIHHHQSGVEELERELISMGDSTDDVMDALFNADINSYTPEDLEYSPIIMPRHLAKKYLAPKLETDWVVL